MRSSILSSLLVLLLLGGCVPLRPPLLKPCAWDTARGPGLASPFDGKFEKMLFRATIDIRKVHLTGMMMVKVMPDSSTRIVFSNEIGMTFFDFVMKKDSFEPGYIFEPMNRKALIGMFRTCFELMLTYRIDAAGNKAYCDLASGDNVIYGRFGRYKTWAGTPAGREAATYINGMTNFSDQAYIRFSDFHGEVPFATEIDNPFVDLRIRLNMISM